MFLDPDLVKLNIIEAWQNIRRLPIYDHSGSWIQRDKYTIEKVCIGDDDDDDGVYYYEIKRPNRFLVARRVGVPDPDKFPRSYGEICDEIPPLRSDDNDEVHAISA